MMVQRRQRHLPAGVLERGQFAASRFRDPLEYVSRCLRGPRQTDVKDNEDNEDNDWGEEGSKIQNPRPFHSGFVPH